MIKIFFGFEVGKIIKYFRTKTLAKVITFGLSLAVFFFVGSGIYFFFVSGFRYISLEAVEDSSLALSLFLYEVFLLIFAGVTVFSAMVSGLFNLFRGGYNNWIISSPGYKLFPRMIFIKSLMASSLPSVIMFVPAILAFNKVYGLGFISLPLILLSVLMFLIIINALTLLFVLAVGSLYYTLSKRVPSLRFTFKGLIAFLLSIIACIVYALWKVVATIDLVKVFKADVDSEVLSVSNIADHFTFLPTHPFAMEILNWQNNQQGDAVMNFILLSFVASFTLFIWWKVSSLFYPLWQKFQEGTLQKEVKDGAITNNAMYRFEGSTTMALFKKEALVSSRNFKGILWFLFLFIIWLMQVGTNLVLGNTVEQNQTDISQKIAILQGLQFIIAIYFISSFTLRFVFPSFSVEKKTAWILGTAPLSFIRIFFAKYMFYVSFFVVLGLLMSYINSYVLNFSFVYTLYSICLFILATIFTVTLGLALGALFPNHETDDPEVITTSMPGLFFTALALIYGGAAAFVLYRVLLTGNTTLLVVFIGLSIVTIGIMLLKVPQFVNKRSF